MMYQIYLGHESASHVAVFNSDNMNRYGYSKSSTWNLINSTNSVPKEDI